ncbi:MAG: PorV/PorQ family protein [Bacteroidetes bacterium]|nr:PorV/PorQ family protein [Bacteroidota bacterium]
MKPIFLVFCFSLLTTPLFAQLFGDLGSNRVATSSFQFLKIGIGAREAAMAETGVSVSADANTLFWNPAHIAWLPTASTSFSYNRWYADIYQTALATVFQWEEIGSFGFSFNYLSTDPMERRTTFQPFGTGEKFNYYDLAAGVTYARQMTQQFTFGLTGKLIREQLAEVSYTAYTLDLGMTYLMDDNRGTRLAIALMNFGGRYKPEGTVTPPDGDPVSRFQDYQAPSNFRIGMSTMIYQDDIHQILGAAQLNHPNDGAENYAIGAEYGFMDLLFLRSGLKLNVEEQSIPSFGLGFRRELLSFDIRFDYAATHISPLGLAHRLSLSMSLPQGDLR